MQFFTLLSSCLFRSTCDNLTYKADSVPCLHGGSRGHSQGLVTLLGTCLLFSPSPECIFQPYVSGISSRGFRWRDFTAVSHVYLQRVSSPVGNSLSDLLKVGWLVVGCFVLATGIKQKKGIIFFKWFFFYFILLWMVRHSPAPPLKIATLKPAFEAWLLNVCRLLFSSRITMREHHAHLRTFRESSILLTSAIQSRSTAIRLTFSF